jgi:formate dehydrogenase major subunit
MPLIVIDPQRTKLALAGRSATAAWNERSLTQCDGPRPGQGEGLLDQSFIATRTEGIADWLKTVSDCTPEAAGAVTGVPANLLCQAARRYGNSGASLCIHGLGVKEHRWGSHGVIALCNLAPATGNIEKPGTGINPLRGQNYVQRASDMGCLCVTGRSSVW